MKIIIFLLCLPVVVLAQRTRSPSSATSENSAPRQTSSLFRGQLQNIPSTNTNNFDLAARQQGITNGFDTNPSSLQGFSDFGGLGGLNPNSGFNTQFSGFPYNQNPYIQTPLYNQYPLNQYTTNQYLNPYLQYPYNQKSSQYMYSNLLMGQQQLPFGNTFNPLGYNQLMAQNYPYNNALYSNQMGVDPLYLQQLMLNQQLGYFPQQPLLGASSSVTGENVLKESGGKRPRVTRQ